MVDVIIIAATFASFYGIYAILAVSLNLEYGFGGQPNFGQVLFYGVGAFVAGTVTANLLPLLAHVPTGNICAPGADTTRVLIAINNPGFAVPVWILGLILAMITGGIFGLLLSYPAIRVKEEWYLSMILLVAAEAFVIVIENTYQIGCGIFGLDGIQNPFSFIFQSYASSPLASTELGIDLPSITYALIILGFAGLCYLIAQRLANSPYGRLLKSVRDDRVASESLGKDVSNVRKQIMIIGSIMAGLSGGLYVYFIGVAVPDDYSSAVTFTIWVMIILGGNANNKGAMLGALVLTLLQRGSVEVGILIQPLIPNFNADVVVYLEYVLQAVVLILLLLFRPKGLIPEGRIKTRAYELFDFGKSKSKDSKPEAMESSEKQPTEKELLHELEEEQQKLSKS